MSDQGSVNGAAQTKRMLMERRRREFRTRLPECLCGNCLSVVFAEEESCLECESKRQDSGWPALRDFPDPWLGKVIDGRYLIVKQLGQGSSAAVYRAESLSISRQFAVKIISTGQGRNSEHVVERLNREVEALGRLRNPHIISFYEVLELPGFFVAALMDFIDGLTLEALVHARGFLSVARACTLLRQIANGLYEAHQAGMIHRDLKPENIMVERLPAGDDFVYVLDFGIVQFDNQAGVNMTHGFIGTPLYASPEQAGAGSVDHRSDIYSLGAVLFFMLTGRPPFVSNNVYEVLKMQVRTPAPRLSDVSPEKHFPEELEDLVRRMLAKSPGDRPTDLSRVIDELDHLALINQFEAQLQESSGMHATVPAQLSRSSQPFDPSNPFRPSQSSDIGPETGGHELSEPSVRSTNLGRPPASPAPESEFERGQHDSAATIIGIAAREGGHPKRESIPTPREPVETPLFVRQITPTQGQPLRPLPARITYAVEPLASAVSTAVAASNPGPEAPPVDSSKTLGACSQTPLFALLEPDSRTLRIFGELSAAPRTVTLAQGLEVRALALTPSHVVLGHDDGTLSQCALDGSGCEQLFQDVRQVAISAVGSDAHGRIIVAGSRSGRLYMRAAQRAQSDWTRLRSGEPVQCVALSAGGESLAVARDSTQIEIYQMATPRAPALTFDVDAAVTAMAISPDNYLLAAALENNTVVLFQVLTGKAVMTIDHKDRRLLGLYFSAMSTPMAFFEQDGRAAVEDLQEIAARSRAN
ncbi:MAG: protein kinase [Bradymonadaceae bacterium]|nr:protein kinase [Lujinxingiaceae bacterium]